MTDPHLSQLIRSIAGDKACEELLGTLQIDRMFQMESLGAVSRGVFAMALNALLFQDLLSRAPTGAAYVADRRRQRERIHFDHAGLRTVRFNGPSPVNGNGNGGCRPAGSDAVARLLEPLGYEVTGTYPLDDLGMTGVAFTHREFPETLPQFFVSELHVERFSREFQAAAQRVYGGVRDPLTSVGLAALAEFAEQGRCEMRLAVPALREIVGAFGRWHELPRLADYRVLAAESPEAAWMATDGASISHVSDRVLDVAMTACAQRSLGRPVKASIDISEAGSVRLTAFKADPLHRTLRADDGSQVDVAVPGSFYEFISRDLVTGADGKKRLDLRFENAYVRALFKKTAAG